MTLSIQRGRQFLAGDTSTQLFDGSGKAGAYLSRAAQKLSEAQHTVLLTQGTATVRLATADDWKQFLATHASSREQVGRFAESFGISFDDFCNVVDDLAASDERGLEVDLSPTSELSTALSLDRHEGDYARRLAADQAVRLGGVGGTQSEARLVPSPVIGPEVLSTPIEGAWERDRTEQEAWADFKVGNGSDGVFRRTNAITLFEKLYEPRWSDPEAMALVERFAMPLHLEKSSPRPDGTVTFQDKDEMFRETYFDDANGALERAGASVRARVRFDDNEPYTVRRVLIQGKQGRAVDASGNSAVHKFEKRFEGTATVDEAKAQDLLRNGKDLDGGHLKVAQLLYKTVKEAGTLNTDEGLRLEPKHVVLQKRRRSHMVFETPREVTARREALQKEVDALKAANQPVPDALSRFLAKVEGQERFLTEASELLRRHGQYLPANTDGFIISADRYSVYDPSARQGLPNELDDEAGRVGRGLHLEAEWDTASSDPFEKAAKVIQEKLAASPPPANGAELEADLARLKEMSALILKDVAQAVAMMKEKMVAAGLEPDDRHASKEERASEFMRRPDRPIFWL
jgi:hypothetical protein